jgi:hydroxysqualene synthase
MDTSGHGGAYHAGNHYENFPVGSWLIPKAMRPAVLALYHFARTADDLADEGVMAAQDRIKGLMAMKEGLLAGSADHPAPGNPGLLGHHLDQHGLSKAPALDLLEAFMADAQHQPMANAQAVLAYCAKSANPVGRLMLGFAGLANNTHLIAASDAICTGLQLANFAQDLRQDLDRGRVYFPGEWWPHGWAPAMGAASLLPKDQHQIALQMAAWAEEHLNAGAGLAKKIRQSSVAHAFRFGLEIGITIEGGREICRMIQKNPAAVWQGSPRIGKTRLPAMVFRGLMATL